MQLYIQIIVRLLLSGLLGGLIGLEREIHNRPAGLRTHMLVTLGSTLIMLVSISGFKSGDPSRLAAQVISGIGFLGAGTILRDGNEVSGLTTAASIWICGGIGLAIGNGYYFGAFFTTFLVLFSLFSLGFIEKRIINKKFLKIKVECSMRNELISELTTLISKYNINIQQFKITNPTKFHNKSTIILKLSIKSFTKYDIYSLIDNLTSIDGVNKIIY